jgi:hypothetical protein
LFKNKWICSLSSCRPWGELTAKRPAPGEPSSPRGSLEEQPRNWISLSFLSWKFASNATFCTLCLPLSLSWMSQSTHSLHLSMTLTYPL